MEKKIKDSSYIIPNLDRALRVMELLSNYPDGLTMSEIAEALKIPKNSAFRITATMEYRGFLERIPSTKAFSLTNKMTTISHATLAEKSLVDCAWDAMQSLRDECMETVLFGTLIGHEGAILEQAPAKHNFKFTVDIGTRFSLHTAAPGKAMLAFMNDNDVKQIVSKIKFEKFTDKTITSAEEYMENLKKVRTCGYGVDCDEEREGMRCLSVAVFNEKKYPLAAIWITGPSSRLPLRDFPKFGMQLKKAAESISKRLGG
jgi:DNA-binding IclR family transcriptional regulator